MKQLRENDRKTGILSDEMGALQYPTTFARVLKDVKALDVAHPYRHPSGDMMWVNIPGF
ncbi:MAG TPA: hypothetical protein VFO86_10060 [Terriglobia bacterium]|nr:hypothetical protein [Terriglobia bacterium]